MKVRCNLCGAPNTIHPGQKMLFCEFCGSAVAISDLRGPEHLILPHQRNDQMAREMLISHLKSRRRKPPSRIEADFSYLPFYMEEGDGTINPLAAANPGMEIIPPYPPAGDYRFFEPSMADEQEILPAQGNKPEARYLLHLPVYTLKYSVSGVEQTATVVGESWQVLMDELPPRKDLSVNRINFLAAAALFILFLFAGKISPNITGRTAIIGTASLTVFLLYKMRERLVKKV